MATEMINNWEDIIDTHTLCSAFHHQQPTLQFFMQELSVQQSDSILTLTTQSLYRPHN